MNYRCIYCSTTKIDDDLPHVLLDDENSVVQTGVCGFCLRHTLGISPNLFLLLNKYHLTFIPFLLMKLFNLIFKVNLFLIYVFFMTAFPYLLSKMIPFKIAFVIAFIYFFLLPINITIIFNMKNSVNEISEKINVMNYYNTKESLISCSIFIFSLFISYLIFDLYTIQDYQNFLSSAIILGNFYALIPILSNNKYNNQYIENNLISFKNKSELNAFILEANEEKANSYNIKAFDLETEDKYEEALEHYTMALALNPNDCGIHFSRGRIYMEELLEYEKAIKDFSSVIYSSDLVNDMLYTVSSYFMRGKCHYFLDNIEFAQQDFDKAISLDPIYSDEVSDFIDEQEDDIAFDYEIDSEGNLFSLKADSESIPPV